MKKNMHRLLSLVLALALCLSLGACGKDEGSAKGDKQDSEVTTLADELGYGYVSTYSDLQAQVNWVGNVSSAQGKLYFTGDYFDEETYENGTKLYEVDPVTGVTTEVPLPAMENSNTVSEYIQQISVCPDGSGYWVFSERYVYASDIPEAETMPAVEGEMIPEEAPSEDMLMPEEIPEEEMPEEDAGLSAEYQVETLSAVAVPLPADGITEEAVEEPAEDDLIADDMAITDDYYYQEPESSSFAKKYDMSGNVVSEIDLTAVTAEMDYFYPQALAQNVQGELYVAADTYVLVFGADGSYLNTIEMGERWVQYMVASANGTVAVSFYDSEAMGMVICTLENGQLSEPLDTTGINETGSMMIYSGSGDTVMLNNGTSLYSLDLKTGVGTELLSWLDADINGGSINGLAATDMDTILVFMADYREEITYELATLKKTPADQLPQRTLLTLGAEYLSSDIQNAIIDFNRSNETYRVTLIDYSEYNTTEDYTLGIKQMDRDVVSGNCPDIVSLSSGHHDRYIAKGALADLTALMEKDQTLTLDSLVQAPLQGYMSDGKLYGIPLYFNVETMLASKRLVGDRTTWTMNELGEIIRGLEEGVDIMSYTYQESFLNQMIYQNLSQFVDFGNASCSFDSQEFKDLLAVCALLPTEEAYNAETEAMNTAMENGDWVYMDDNQRIQAGELLMATQWVSDAYSLKNYYNLYSEDNGFVAIGYPISSGNGALIYAGNALGISATTEHMDGAWAFMKSILGEEAQSEVYNFPITVSAFDAALAEAMEKSYYMEDGEKVYYDDYGWIGETEYTLEPLNQEQVDAFKALVDGAMVSGVYDSDIMVIIEEEAGAYFAGDKSADEVANLIQNRVTIYLGENS